MTKIRAMPATVELTTIPAIAPPAGMLEPLVSVEVGTGPIFEFVVLIAGAAVKLVIELDPGSALVILAILDILDILAILAIPVEAPAVQ
jgi:hypothetical protein